MKIGICGMGRMGASIARRLLDCGHEVTVWNRDPAKASTLADAGAKLAGTPAELVGKVELTITMLLNADALDAVYNGKYGLLSADVAGKPMIDMSTVLPSVAEKIGAKVKAKGGRFIECPVGGTVGPAREGKLLGMAGGDEADVALAKPVLQQICRRIEHVGGVGAGAKLKLAINLPLMVYWQALGEALLLAAPLNLAPARLIDILSDTSGTPNAMKGRGPDIARLLSGETIGAPAFEIDAARKDLATMTAYAGELGARLPLTETTLASFSAAHDAGHGQEDPINVPVLFASGKLKSGTSS